MRYIDNVIVPNVVQQRESLGLPVDAKALCLFDVFATHRTDTTLDKLRQNNIVYEFIPAGCTSHLQPLDVHFNSVFKYEMKKKSTAWYSDVFATRMKEGEDAEVSLTTSAMKPLHAVWLMEVWHSLREKPDIARTAFEQCGIAQASVAN